MKGCDFVDDYWIWLENLKYVSLKKKLELLKIYKTPDKLFLAEYIDIKNIIINKEVFDIGFTGEKLDKARVSHEHSIKLGIKFITPDSSLYKPGLGIVTYYKGNIFGGISYSVIGTRDCCAYGVHYTRLVCNELATNKICINSGLARGIDKWAHTFALTNKIGTTQAFVATGLDICYPNEHKRLMAEIIEQGAVISPFGCGEKPLRHNFIIRNRLMSIWSDAVVVVEAPKKSGALITADFAKNFGKEVYTINPRSMSNRCEGNRILLASGAKEFVLNDPDNFIIDAEQNEILKVIKESKISMDTIKSKLNLTYPKLEELLIELEHENLISLKGDGNWHYNGW